MARLRHEVWLDPEGLEGCVLAGPAGDDARRACFGPGSRLIHTFEAGSYLEAMQTYHALLGREPYVSSCPEQDALVYPDEWRKLQGEARDK
jgi:hypothetical protein